jgi:SHS2 domain-containing protein
LEEYHLVETGHRILAHTADIRIEAWAPTFADCVAEAVRALVASFADVPHDIAPTGAHQIRLEPGPADDRLVAALEEVLYLLDARGEVPVRADLQELENGGLSGTFGTVALAAVETAGAGPKAVSYGDLAIERTTDGWRCVVTVDV